jgi:protein-S-isoprenylcysteine O-methyltransferase Ste14
VTLLLKNVVFTLIVPGVFGVYLPLVLTRGASARLGLALYASLGFLTLALSIYSWSIWNFAARGYGTPLPIDAPKRLVVQGPYRYTRNPMYLAVFSALLGWLILFQTTALLLYALIFAAVAILFVVGYEEPHLARTFGADYDRYRAQVPRWLPRLPRSPDA